MPRWLVEIGTPNGLRSHAFLGSSPSWGTINFGSVAQLVERHLHTVRVYRFESYHYHQFFKCPRSVLWGVSANWEHAGLASRSKGFDSPTFHQVCLVRLMAGPRLYTAQTAVRFCHEVPNI